MQKAKILAVKIGKNVRSSVKENFLFATLNFLFIAGFIQLFNFVFGQENSVVAIIITILMGITAGKDVSEAPIKRFFSTFFVFGGMCVAACFSVSLGVWIAIPINLAVTFLLLYAYTYEYSSHLYFPYILSYLFLIYISPVTPSALPNRLLSVAVGSLVMVFYALVLTYRNIRKPAKNAMNELLDEARLTVNAYALAGALPNNGDKVRGLVRKLCKNTENRRRGTFRISESVFSSLDAARGIENLIIYLKEPFWNENPYGAEFWATVAAFLGDCRSFVNRKTKTIPEPDDRLFSRDERTRYLYCVMIFIRTKFLASRAKAFEPAPYADDENDLFSAQTKPRTIFANQSEQQENASAKNGARTKISLRATTDAEARALDKPARRVFSEQSAQSDDVSANDDARNEILAEDAKAPILDTVAREPVANQSTQSKCVGADDDARSKNSAAIIAQAETLSSDTDALTSEETQILRLEDVFCGTNAELDLTAAQKKDSFPVLSAKPEQICAPKTLSAFDKLKIAANYSPVRLAYAARVAVLLTLFMIPIQYFALPHGKWLMFTLASVSLPYAEDVPKKGLKRFCATLIGGGIAFLLFSLIPDPNARTAIMMLSGYLSFYFKDYLGNYAMATVGALGGAVFLTSFGFQDVGTMFFIRIGYIAAGIGIAFFANLVLFPYRKKRATEEIFKKYELTSDFLADLKTTSLDRQLYYKIVVENNLLEEKLLSNAKQAERELAPVIESRRRKIRRAHHENFKKSA